MNGRTSSLSTSDSRKGSSFSSSLSSLSTNQLSIGIPLFICQRDNYIALELHKEEKINCSINRRFIFQNNFVKYDWVFIYFTPRVSIASNNKKLHFFSNSILIDFSVCIYVMPVTTLKICPHGDYKNGNLFSSSL